jgi:hypothetical protein
MPLESSRHFLLIAEVRREEVGTHEHQDDVGCLEMRTNLVGPRLSCDETSVVPEDGQVRALQAGEVRLQLRPQPLIFVRIRDENLEWQSDTSLVQTRSPRMSVLVNAHGG